MAPQGPGEEDVKLTTRAWHVLAAAALLLASRGASAQTGIDLLTVTNGSGEAQSFSVSLQIFLLMTALSILPALLITMTSFTRIVIVLAILRQGLGTQQTPSNQVMIGLAFFLTLFVMMPVAEQVNEKAVAPYLADTLAPADALLEASHPLRTFMLAQTREADLALFASMSVPEGESASYETPQDVPFPVLLPAFVTSELKTAFQIGFLLLIPFLIIDLVVASVLMSMGMVMLSPLIISLPFKIMLFVLVDGWSLVMSTLVGSFHGT
jgi:flagellar biosynthetic protein FliP